MKFFIKNANLSVSVSLTTLAFTGFWAPDYIQGPLKTLYNCYAVFSFMFLLGVYILIQLVDMYLIWGDLQLMSGTAFVLFTNLAQLTKIINLLLKKARIAAIIDDADDVLTSEVGEEGKKIVKKCDRETTLFQLVYFGLTTVTICGWASSAEKNSLPLRAWYPYDTTKSPAFELTYCHQVGALFIAAYLNVAKDSLVSALIAQNRCRLQLLNMALRNIHEGLNIDGKSNALITPTQEKIARARLRRCVKSHQAALHSAQELQECFTLPTFAQFAVSMVIICVTAFQLASQTKNLVRFLSMTTYLMNMVFQVFIYCYQGNELREESIAVAANAYECLWFRSSIPFRRALLILMMRTRRPIVLKAGAFTALSLSSFMAIIKTSYSFFTLLQQVEDSI